MSFVVSLLAEVGGGNQRPCASRYTKRQLSLVRFHCSTSGFKTERLRITKKRSVLRFLSVKT